MIGIPFFIKNKPRLIATGGTITTASSATGGAKGDKIHKFLQSGTFSCLGRGYIQLLIVSGGGGGGKGYATGPADLAGGAGGYGGGMTFSSKIFVNIGDYNIVVGSGGARSTNSSRTNGEASSAIGLTSPISGIAGGVSSANQAERNGNEGIAYYISGGEHFYGAGGGAGAYSGIHSAATGGQGGYGAGSGGSVAAIPGGVESGASGTNYGGAGGGGAAAGSNPLEVGNGGLGHEGVVYIRYIPI